MKLAVLLTICCVSFLGILWLGDDTPEQDQTYYCEMVKLGKESNDPNVGWPDYRGVYDQVCR